MADPSSTPTPAGSDPWADVTVVWFKDKHRVDSFGDACANGLYRQFYLASAVEKARATVEAQHAHEIAALRAQIRADDERLRAAGERVQIWFGCDTADHLADEIAALRAQLADQVQP